MAAHYFQGPTISKRYTTLRDATLKSSWLTYLSTVARDTDTAFAIARRDIPSSSSCLIVSIVVMLIVIYFLVPS